MTKLKIRDAAKSIGAFGLVAAIDPTGAALTITALQQIWALVVDHAPTQKNENEPFLKGIVQYLIDVDYDGLSGNEARELLDTLTTILNTFTFADYDLASANDDATIAIDKIMQRSQTSLSGLSDKQKERCTQFVGRYLILASANKQYLTSSAHAFQKEIGDRFHKLEKEYHHLKEWIELVTRPRILIDTEKRTPNRITPTVFLTAEWSLIALVVSQRSAKEAVR